MKKKEFVNSLVSLASMTVGAMGSRIAADAIPMQNNTIKRGLLVLGGIAGASSLDRKTTMRKIGQDAAISMAVTQTGYLLRDWLGDSFKDNKLLSPALGSPLEDYAVLDSSNFLSSYKGANYDFISEDIGYEEVQDFAG